MDYVNTHCYWKWVVIPHFHWEWDWGPISTENGTGGPFPLRMGTIFYCICSNQTSTKADFGVFQPTEASFCIFQLHNYTNVCLCVFQLNKQTSKRANERTSERANKRTSERASPPSPCTCLSQSLSILNRSPQRGSTYHTHISRPNATLPTPALHMHHFLLYMSQPNIHKSWLWCVSTHRG